jgi:predicted DNA-binding protein (MmcQ/YjbR family)
MLRDMKDRRVEVQAICQALPHAELTFPFNDSVAVYKVGGKMFALVSLDDSDQLSVKADPEDGIALRAEHPTLQPGYHLNKRHWLTARLSDAQLPAALFEELVTDSYAIVLASLPRAARAGLGG